MVQPRRAQVHPAVFARDGLPVGADPQHDVGRVAAALRPFGRGYTRARNARAMVAEEDQQGRTAQRGQPLAQGGQHRVAMADQPHVAFDQIGLASATGIGRPGTVVLDGNGIKQAGQQIGAGRAGGQIEDHFGHRCIGHVTAFAGPRRGEVFLADQFGKAACGHDRVAPVKAHVVRVDEPRVPAGQPRGQGIAGLAQRGEERVVAAKAERFLLAPEQHAIFGAHGIGAKTADFEVAPLEGCRAGGFESG